MYLLCNRKIWYFSCSSVNLLFLDKLPVKAVLSVLYICRVWLSDCVFFILNMILLNGIQLLSSFIVVHCDLVLLDRY